MKLSERASNLQPSATLAISGKAKALKKEGKDVIDFGAGQPDFEPPSFIKTAIKAAIDKPGIGKYTAVPGTPEAREAITKKLKSDYNLDYTSNEVMVTVGGKCGLFNIFQALIDKDDEVIIPSPYWVSYPEQVKFCNGTPVIVETDNNFKLQASSVEAAITDKTKIIILNSPSNPTGAVSDEEELIKIANLAVEKDILIISDEIYDKIIFDKKHLCIPAISEAVKKQTIYCNALSKTYAVPGLRLGYIAANESLIKALTAIQGQSTSNPDALMQEALIVAFSSPMDEVNAMVEEFKKRRDYIVQALNEIPGVECPSPDGAFYVFPKIPTDNSLQFATDLLEKKLVAVVPGAPFGRESHVRISYAASLDNIKEGVKRIREFIEN